MTEILFIERAPVAGTEHRLDAGATIGRKGCDVTLDDSDVSRRHAIVRLEGAAVEVEDLGSTNGTFVNDARIDGVTVLSDGDHLRFGDVVWELRTSIQATRAQAVEPGAAPTRAVPVQAPKQGLSVTPPPTLPERSAPPAPSAPSAPSASSERVARPAEPRRGESRGDVPMPDFAPAKAARVAAAPAKAPAFSPAGGRFKRSAARRLEATVISYGVVLATAVAIAAYFAQR